MKTTIGFARVVGRFGSSTSRSHCSLQLRVSPFQDVPAHFTLANGMVWNARAQDLSKERYNWWHSLRKLQLIAVCRLYERRLAPCVVGLEPGASRFLRTPWSAEEIQPDLDKCHLLLFPCMGPGTSIERDHRRRNRFHGPAASVNAICLVASRASGIA